MEWLYVGFIAFILALLVLDLGVFHRQAHVVKMREALTWSAVWISLGVAFSGFIYLGYEHHWLGLGTTVDTMATPVVGADGVAIYNDGGSAVVKYLTGFLVEKSLAVDNIFVIAMIFGFFAVPPIYQHRVLFWGIVGALVMRGVMIAVGAALITRFTWIIYVFGAFLILTGVKMLVMRGGATDLNDNLVVRLVRRLMPVTERYHGERFFVRAGTEASHAPAVAGGPIEVDRVVDLAKRGALLATPLFLALLLVELTDLIFAVDSIPAIFAITTDPFLVFTSNIFAILGLRSLYFALAGMIDTFRYLKVALSVVLVVIGVKMMTHGWLKAHLGEHFNFYVLGVVGGIIATGVIASLVARRRGVSATVG
ncbi:MAG: TerC family protein [Kofleriaceae bacterium]|jgi:tellurite resistance protein TerC|nr:TerC family protein [Kofleriaceae bacterium]MBP9171644.1 TerC family protein [Kofleriaceae bacterium]MBP9858983.1 TerC family protein [Kofleriaceae bacterium]